MFARTDEDRKLVTGHAAPAPELLRRCLAALLRCEDLLTDIRDELRARPTPHIPRGKASS